MEKAVGKFSLEMLKVSAMLSLVTVGWGWCTLKFWDWFILPIFPSMPILLFNQAVGVSLFMILFNRTIYPDLKEEYYKETKGTRQLISTVAPYFVLGMAWIIKLFL